MTNKSTISVCYTIHYANFARKNAPYYWIKLAKLSKFSLFIFGMDIAHKDTKRVHYPYNWKGKNMPKLCAWGEGGTYYITTKNGRWYLWVKKYGTYVRTGEEQGYSTEKEAERVAYLYCSY